MAKSISLDSGNRIFFFAQELRSAFENEAREKGRTRLALAAAVHFTSDGGYDGRILNQLRDIQSNHTTFLPLLICF
jgi:hypothetical protein